MHSYMQRFFHRSRHIYSCFAGFKFDCCRTGQAQETLRRLSQHSVLLAGFKFDWHTQQTELVLFDTHSVLLAGFKSACQQMCVLASSQRMLMYALTSADVCSVCLYKGIRCNISRCVCWLLVSVLAYVVCGCLVASSHHS